MVKLLKLLTNNQQAAFLLN